MHLNTFRPHFWLNRNKIALSYLLKKKKVWGGPQEICLETTNRCNLDCIMCPQPTLKRPSGDIDFALFKKIASEARNTVELIYLHLAGEPLLHPKIFEMIETCKMMKMPVGLSTNATLLDEKYSKELIRSKLDYLILSFDAFKPETYEAIRRGADFNKTLSNIERFIKIKGPRGKKPFTLVQLVYMEPNKNELQDFLSFWEKKEIDIARAKPFVSLAGVDKRLRPIEWLNINTSCFLPWRQLALYWDGTAVSCYFDYVGGTPIGDLKKQTLKEVWNSKAMQDIREKHLRRQGHTIKICQNCERPHLNIFALGATTLLDGLTFKKILPIIEKKALLRTKLKNLSYFSEKG